MSLDVSPLAEYALRGPYRAGVVTLDLRDPEQPLRRLADSSAEALAARDSALDRVETPEASSRGIPVPPIIRQGNGATR